jgi:rubrerythrin
MLLEAVANTLRDVAFRVGPDTDGYNSINVHLHHEGLTLAAEIVRTWVCPTCAPPVRETANMVCQTCGKDYAQ